MSLVFVLVERKWSDRNCLTECLCNVVFSSTSYYTREQVINKILVHSYRKIKNDGKVPDDIA